MRSLGLYLLASLLTLSVSASKAHAAVIMTLEQVGPNVVATGAGTIDLTGLTLTPATVHFSPFIIPATASLTEGEAGLVHIYTGVSEPANFGSGGGTFASSGTGDPLGVGSGALLVASSYVSGAPLSSSATFNSTTLSALGVTPGIYTWTWGSNAHADSLTLYAGVPVPTPEPAPALLLVCGAAAFALFKRLRAWQPRQQNF